jgi:hypothetical protein
MGALPGVKPKILAATLLMATCWLAGVRSADADAQACQVLTKSDVTIIVHVKVADGVPLTGKAAAMLPSGATSCVYRRPGAADADMVATITVTRAAASMFDTIAQNYESPALAAIGAPQALHNLGQKAMYIPVGRQLIVYQKGYIVNISDFAGGLQQAEELAGRAITRL